VHIDDDRPGLVADFCQHALGGPKRAIDGTHERAAQQAKHGDERAVFRVRIDDIAARRLAREVRRLADSFFAFERWNNFVAALDMIAHRDEIDPGRAHLAILLGSQPRAAANVFRIGNDEIEREFFNQLRNKAANRFDAGGTYDVADEEELHDLN